MLLSVASYPSRVRKFLIVLAAVCVMVGVTTVQARQPHAEDPLPSWNLGAARTAIVDFVRAVTDDKSPSYVAPDKRIAVFDNDGTLWIEHPMYTQMVFVIDRIRELAPLHPEWKTQEPFRSVMNNTLEGLLTSGKKGLIALVMAAQTGMTDDEFAHIVTAWLAKARHPRFHKPYTELVYQPMIEVLEYMRANGFKTFVVSGGGVEFMRPWTQAAYGIPPEQVVGSTVKTQFVVKDGTPAIMRLPQIDFINDAEGKPLGINTFIGRHPIAAFGNADGDLQMLQWTAAGEGPRLVALVHHTDGEREYAYDRHTHVGKLDKALDAAQSNGWTLIDMKKDWKIVFPFEKQ